MKINKFDVIVLVGIGVWFVETWYFGFNQTAVSGFEKAFDTVSSVLMFWGAIGSVVSSIKPRVIFNVDGKTISLGEKE